MMALLLAGFFVAPALLLRLGQRLRHRSRRARGVFWGGVAGHSLGTVVMLAAAHVPAVLWEDGGWRALAVHGALLGGAVLGAAAGAVWGWRRDGAPPAR